MPRRKVRDAFSGELRNVSQPALWDAVRGPDVRHFPISFFLFFYKFIYLYFLFLAALGLRCCAQAFSSCSEQELLFVALHGLLIAVASLVAEHRL